MHLVLHAPFGSRLNRAWGLALRKRFCRTFNFELQAAATEDAIVLSLGPHAQLPAGGRLPLPPLEHGARRARRRRCSTRRSSACAGAGTPAGRSPSRAQRGGKKVPPPLLRMQAEDLIAVVFPDQLACLENIVGEREIPEHPLVEQTAPRLPGRGDGHRGPGGAAPADRGAARSQLVARDLTEPSPLAHEILNAQPYAFLDDAPLEERRTQAVIAPPLARSGDRLGPRSARRRRPSRGCARRPGPTRATPDELHDAL